LSVQMNASVQSDLSVQTILVHPNERLRRESSEIIDFDASLMQVFTRLEATMQAGPGGVGIAAPQVGDNRRMIVVDCSHSLRPCKHHGLLYMANPVIESVSGKSLGREGCLSVPDWVGMVHRPAKIQLSYDDEHGVHQHIKAVGFEARVIQHEIDHLNGILFIDKVVSSRDLMRRMSA